MATRWRRGAVGTVDQVVVRAAAAPPRRQHDLIAPPFSESGWIRSWCAAPLLRVAGTTT